MKRALSVELAGKLGIVEHARCSILMYMCHTFIYQRLQGRFYGLN